MTKIISLTFDYELFLKKSGTPENCILKPVDRLMNIFEKTGIKATFFVDSLYYQRLLEHDNVHAELIKNQLKTLVSMGQRIELHLHPVWLDAAFIDGEWYFNDYRYYRLDAMDKSRIKDLFSSQTKLLNDIARQVDPEYSMMAFRAGGLCIEPFGIIKESFKNTGIVIDSSVAYNTYHLDGVHDYDFRKFPDREFYRFSTDTGIINENGRFLEIPITVYKINIFDKAAKKIASRLSKNKFRIYGDGEGVSLPVRRSFIDKISDTYSMFSLESIAPRMLTKKTAASDKKVITFISHPKLLSESSFECIEKLHSQGHEFMNLKEIYEISEKNPGTSSEST